MGWFAGTRKVFRTTPGHLSSTNPSGRCHRFRMTGEGLLIIWREPPPDCRQSPEIGIRGESMGQSCHERRFTEFCPALCPRFGRMLCFQAGNRCIFESPWGQSIDFAVVLGKCSTNKAPDASGAFFVFMEMFRHNLIIEDCFVFSR
jgi:hypothetical protein